MRGPRRRNDRILAQATRVIRELHTCTREEIRLDSATIGGWVHAPLRRVMALPTGKRAKGVLRDAAGRLRDELEAALAGRTVRASWIHGDFWPGNLLASGHGGDLTGDVAGDVTGVVDWDGASPRQLPLHDLLHLYVFSRRLTSGDELGDVVVRALRDGISEATGMPAGSIAAWLDGIPERTAVLLYWLRHVLLFIDTEGHHDNPRWIRANVQRVLTNV
jgi:aminoglycoside phosphotransferase (APT) family kinase protein